ncbi:MAG: ComF family protein [bacterium]|nr:ComF family protein [bacterium]
MIRSIWNDLTGIFLPDLCLICQIELSGFGEYLCPACWRKLPIFPDRGAEPLRPLRGVLKHLWIGWDYDDNMKRVIHLFKYHQRPELADVLVREWLETTPKAALLQDAQLLLPVPIHAARRRWRGFNQSERLADALSRRLNVPVADEGAVRIVNTPSQTRLSRGERWGNLAQAFQIKHPEIVAGRRTILVDDLATSGATLHILAQLLLQNGAAEVSAAVLTSPAIGDW